MRPAAAGAGDLRSDGPRRDFVGGPAGGIREADLEFLEHPHGNVLKSIKVSIDALADDEKRRFAELSVFPPDETIPEAAVETLWRTPARWPIVMPAGSLGFWSGARW